VVPVTSMTVKQMRAMSREEVEALDPADREYRRGRIAGDPTPVGIRQIAEMANVGRDAVSGWRGVYLETGESSDEALVEPDPDLNGDDVRKPGEISTGRGGSPRWRASTVWAWLHGTGRVDDDYFPRPGGRKPPGRPPRQRADTEPEPAAV
jgi:hypothetical protein